MKYENHLDLFSGIGGFSFAFESAGFRTVGFSEICPDASMVLSGRWPTVPNLGDIKRITGDVVRATCGEIAVLTAGVPCQPASALGQMRGTSDERWLWPETLRVVSEVGPRLALFENPPSILVLEGGRAFNGIVSDFSALGYDLFWDVIPAAALGAGHLRERLYIVASNTTRQCKREPADQVDSITGERRTRIKPCSGSGNRNQTELLGAYSDSPRLEGHARDEVPNGGQEPRGPTAPEDLRHLRVWEENWWQTQSPVFPLVDGLSNKLVEAALRCVGNSIVPQVAQIYAENFYRMLNE